MTINRKPGRGIGAIRKDVDPQVATDVRRICQLFLTVCIDQHEAILHIMAAKFGEARAANMVEFYRQNAEYLADLFNYQ